MWWKNGLNRNDLLNVVKEWHEQEWFLTVMKVWPEQEWSSQCDEMMVSVEMIFSVWWQNELIRNDLLNVMNEWTEQEISSQCNQSMAWTRMIFSVWWKNGLNRNYLLIVLNEWTEQEWSTSTSTCRSTSVHWTVTFDYYSTVWLRLVMQVEMKTKTI